MPCLFGNFRKSHLYSLRTHVSKVKFNQKRSVLFNGLNLLLTEVYFHFSSLHIFLLNVCDLDLTISFVKFCECTNASKYTRLIQTGSEVSRNCLSNFLVYRMREHYPFPDFPFQKCFITITEQLSLEWCRRKVVRGHYFQNTGK